MDKLTIIAKLKAKGEAEGQFFEECRKLLGPTRAEEGCINYDMHPSVEDPGLIMFHENWTGRPLWERHVESPHLQEFSANTDDIVECGSFSMAIRWRMPELPPGSLEAGITVTEGCQ